MPTVPQLLAPAGSLAMLDVALAFGATAIYAGQPRYSLRVRNNEFGDLAVLAEGMARARGLGCPFYLVANLFPHGAKLKTFLRDMAPVVALGPDALILSDPGLILLVREQWPDMAIHLSVQANTVNSAAVRFWRRAGISRVILSRELSLDEIAAIRQDCPDTELEVFVHGALCVAYSGRCLLSGYFNRRDANQGACTNACRWEYNLKPARPDPAGDVWLLEEAERREGSYMPVEEDEHGTYILNSRDLRAIEHVGRLVAIGVDALKIEGRTKSPYYVARVCQAYRQAIDDAVQGRGLDPALLGQLAGLANRGYTDGFLQRHHDADTQNYLSGASKMGRAQYVADALTYDPRRRLVRLEARNRLAVGDRVELVQPGRLRQAVIGRLEDDLGQPRTALPGSGHQGWADLPEDAVGAFVARLLD